MRTNDRSRRATAVATAIALTVWLLPAGRVFAADVETTTTLVVNQQLVYRGEVASFEVHVEPNPGSGQVRVEVSADGTIWNISDSGSLDSTGTASLGHVTSISDPEGLRYVRARFLGVTGFQASMSASAQQTISRRPTTVEGYGLSAPGHLAIVPATSPVRLSARLVGIEADSTVEFAEQTPDGWTILATGFKPYSTQYAQADIPGLALGEHTLRARYPGSDYYLPSEQVIVYTVAKGRTNPVVSGPLEVQANHEFELFVGLGYLDAGVQPSGTFTVKHVETGASVYSGDPGGSVAVSAKPLGTHHFVGNYSGDDNFAESSGSPWTVTVVPDTVEVTNVGVSYLTFYPIKDGYRDTTVVRGTRLEPLSVAIRVYSSTNTLVRSASIGRAAGVYSYSWNGRTSTGALLASGWYRVVQTLTDAAGTRKAVTTNVYLSWKKLIYKTGYVTKYGSAISSKGTTGSGRVVISTTSGYARLSASGYPNWAGVGYQFTLPSATVYKSLWFQIYVKGGLTAPANEFGMQNFKECPLTVGDWNAACFDRWEGAVGAPSGAPAWASTAGSVTFNRSGRTVRGLVSVNAFTVYVYKARVKLVYAVLG
jgi:hypothetical protein